MAATMLHTALAVGAALVALAFSMSTFERWLAKRRRHELAWSIALALFSAASFSLAAGAALGFDAVSFRLFYLFGAVVNVPVLALGTVYLLAGQRRGDQWSAAVALLAAFAAGVVVASPLRAPIPPHELVQGKQVFGPLPRIFAAVGSGAGALVILVGSALSAWRLRRGRMLWSNVLIVLGTLTLSASGLLNGVLDAMDAFAVTLTTGICILFAGFLVGAAGGRRPEAAASPVPSGGAQLPSQQLAGVADR
ncbi:MAG TPA: hypothetical protein VHN98_05755 [Acidimicrobiales bacterium]|nr:hypothetical protein [Acidimicrobiales bacterium]